MMIDAHVHLLPDRLMAAIRGWFDTYAWDIKFREGVDETVAFLLAGGVERMVTLPYAHKAGMARALNDFTRDVAARHPSVVPCCTVFPGEEGEEALLDEALGRDGFAGVKIHSHVMKIAPDDPRLDPVWRASARYRKPVVIHCGREPSVNGAYGIDTRTVSGAARIGRTLERHPDAVVIVPHLGADEFAEFEALLSRHANLYLDTTMAISGYFEYGPDLEMLRRHPGRILYGTDFPNIPYEWDREWKVIRALELPPADEALIIGGNAARLFSIEPSARDLHTHA
jgi:predicted TIM-barrel fold metal-dependent hydrolase